MQLKKKSTTLVRPNFPHIPFIFFLNQPLRTSSTGRSAVWSCFPCPSPPQPQLWEVSIHQVAFLKGQFTPLPPFLHLPAWSSWPGHQVTAQWRPDAVITRNQSNPTLNKYWVFIMDLRTAYAWLLLYFTDFNTPRFPAPLPPPCFNISEIRMQSCN